MHFYFEMRIGFLFLFLERGMKMLYQKFQAEDFGLCQMTFLKNIN